VERFGRLARSYDTVLVLGISAALHPFTSVASLAARQFGGASSVHVVDSQNTGAGLGLLVELAAEMAAGGQSIDEIERAVRGVIPHIYSLFSLFNLLPLAEAGLFSQSQALSAQAIGQHSIFMLEEGRLTPMLIVHTPRHVIESLREFAEEFSLPRHVSVSRGPSCALRTRPLKEFVSEAFPGTPYLEQPLSPAQAGLLGDEALAMVILESRD
jgi:fatty acid-binding protein DegV